MANSLDLDPEWGAIDLLEEVEQTFSIQIANEEAERCVTVGDLYDVICAHSPDWDGQDGKCGSSMVFYRMRRSLSPDDKRGVTPDTPLAGIGLEPSRLFKKLEVDTGLRLPGYELTWLGMTGGFLMGGGIMPQSSLCSPVISLLAALPSWSHLRACRSFALTPAAFPPALPQWRTW